MASVVLKNIFKSFVKDEFVINDMNLEVKDGEFLVLVGPSGCGKSTLLRIIAGLETQTSGDVLIAGKVVSQLPPKDRDIAMVFQNYALYPHMSVYENLSFALKRRKISRSEIDDRVHEAVAILDIKDLLKRKPKELSGGQRQRVALGRAIVRAPNVFLFDEPLSNLDAKLRLQMRAEIKNLHAKLGTTMIYVTHDQVEAMTMGDRIVILNDGICQQLGTPMDIFHNPVNMFVAGFLGSPPMNLLRGRIENHKFVNSAISVNLSKFNGVEDLEGQAVVLGARPKTIKIVSNGTQLALKVAEPLGNETVLHLQVGKDVLIVKTGEMDMRQMGDTIGVEIDSKKILLFRPDSGEQIL